MKKKVCKIENLENTDSLTPRKNMVTRTVERINAKLQKGVSINPCNYDEKVLGKMIVKYSNHVSFENFPDLMDDEEFCLEIAKTTLNPIECENYFYQYINRNLLKHSTFRYKFVCALFENDNIYKFKDLEEICRKLGLKKEFEQIKYDADAKLKMQIRLMMLQSHEYAKYNYDGNNPKALRQYKNKRNDEVVLVKNKIDGVKKILAEFKCLTAEEQRQKQEQEEFVCVTPMDFWVTDKN